MLCCSFRSTIIEITKPNFNSIFDDNNFITTGINNPIKNANIWSILLIIFLWKFFFFYFAFQNQTNWTEIEKIKNLFLKKTHWNWYEYGIISFLFGKMFEDVCEMSVLRSKFPDQKKTELPLCVFDLLPPILFVQFSISFVTVFFSFHQIKKQWCEW